MDRQTRRYIAAWVQEKLIPGVADLDELDPEYFRYFEEAIGHVLEDELLQEICQSHSNLAVQIVKDMLVWFRRSFSMIEEGHPFEEEQVALESWTVRPMEHVFERWGFFRKTIANYYTSDEIDSSYHTFRVSEIKLLQRIIECIEIALLINVRNVCFTHALIAGDEQHSGEEPECDKPFEHMKNW